METKVVNLKDLDWFFPQFVCGGDKEFAGHGPNFNISVVLYTKDRFIFSRLHVLAHETKENWSAGYSFEDQLVYTHDTPIYGIASESVSNLSYPMPNKYHDTYIHSMPEGDLVKEYDLRGDRNGQDLNDYTSVRVLFNQLKIFV